MFLLIGIIFDNYITIFTKVDYYIYKNRMPMRHILIAFIAVLISLCSISPLNAQASTSGKDFWVSFGRNSDRAYQDISLQFRIVTTKYTQATVTFTETGEVMSLSLNANTVYTHNLTYAQKQAVYSYTTGKTSKSIHIQTDENVSVYAVNTMRLVTDATIILPAGALGNSYYHLSYMSPAPMFVPDGYTIVAIENNTTIYENGVVKDVLNEGEVYSSYYSTDGTGKHITADNPIAYFVTHSCVYVPVGVIACDCLYEQLHPESSWGTRFFVPVTIRSVERVRIIASQDNTTVNLTGGTLVDGSLTLNAGQWAEIEIYATENGCYIESNNPVGVVSYLMGNSYPGITYPLGDPSIVWIPPIEQFIDGTLVAPFLTTGSTNLTEHYLLIVTPTITKELTEISGGDYAVLTGGEWRDHPSGYSYYNLPLSNENVNYCLKNPEKLMVLGYGLGFEESYYYLAGAAACRLDAHFEVNGIHHRSLNNEFYCNGNIEVEAFVRYPMDAAPGHLRWLINDVEQTAFTDNLRWTTQLPQGSHTISMIVKNENGEVDSLATSFVIKDMLDPVTIYETICQGDSVLFNGKYYNLPGLYTDTLQTALGCDGIVTLDLTVKPVPAVTVTERTVCQNDTVHLVFTGVAPFELDYIFNGTRQTITVSGMNTTLVATQAGENTFGVYSLISANGCSFSEGIEDGVEINGVTWATRNVDAPGTFAEKPEDAGMFYQWNRTVGWSSTDPIVSSDGSSWSPYIDDNTTVWATTNNICPSGYRIPTQVELGRLISAGSQWMTTLNGVNGRLFGSGDETIFLPATGIREYNGRLSLPLLGRYWSSIGVDYNNSAAYSLDFTMSFAIMMMEPRAFAFPVRCVKDPNLETPVQEETITVIPTKDCITNPCVNEPTVTVIEKTVCQNDAVHLVFTGVAPFELDYTFNGVRQTITVSGMSTTLVATQVGENMFIVNSLISANGCSLLGGGVEINGVVWATCNVDAPGAFTDNPEDFGMFYQWNRPIGWSSADPMVNNNGGTIWDSSFPAGTTWEAVNNVCPAGYRVPTDAEAQRLVDAGSRWTTQNGVNGRVFGSGGNTIFLPAAGYRYFDHGELNNTGLTGNYWVNEPLGSYSAHTLYVQDYRAFVGSSSRSYAYSVRCVADFIQKVTVTPIEECTTPNPCENEPIITQHETLAICQNELPYSWRDTVFHVGTESKQIIFERKTVAGCDSIVTLDLTVKPVPAVTVVEKVVCQNDAVHLVFTGVAPFELDYTFNGTRQSITVSGMDMALVAEQAGENIFVVHSLVSANGCSLSGEEKGEDDVKINGVIWATRNVDAPGTFVENPEDAGMFYQWNSTVGWICGTHYYYPPISSDGSSWNSSWDGNGATTWEVTNNICPTGYRVPTPAEQHSLVDAGSRWTALNGVYGRIFGSGDDVIFLPAAAFCNYGFIIEFPVIIGFYWSSERVVTPPTGAIPGFLLFNDNRSLLSSNDTWNGYSVRCVKDAIQKETITVNPIESDAVSVSICQDELPLIWRDTTFAVGTESGVFTFNRQSAAGCDSIVVLNLEVEDCTNPCKNEPTITVVEKVVCQYDTVHLVFTGVAPFELDYTFNGVRQSITVSGMDTVLVATQVGENIFIVNSLISGNGCSLFEDGVEINGVIWATRNVDAPGTFTQNPEDAGMFYQWNSKVGWSSTDPPVSSDGSAWKYTWDNDSSTTWETTNNVCPAGYRIPTVYELESLASAAGQWTTVNGVTGRIFGSDDNTIFLPAAGCRGGSDSQLTSVGLIGYYWSGTYRDGTTAKSMYFLETFNYITTDANIHRYSALSVRCVKDVIQKDIITVTPIEECTTPNPCENEPIITQHETLMICQNELPYNWRDTVFHVGTESKQIVFERKTVAGCDSIVTLDLIVMPMPHYTVQRTICPNDSVFFYGKYYKETGLYTDTLPPIWGLGCGTIVTLDLTVSSVHYKNESLTICQNELPFIWRDTTFAVGTESGTFIFNKQIAEGCDSIITLDLTVKPGLSVAVVERTVCQNDTVHLVFTGIAPFELDYTFNGVRQSITVSGMDTALVATQVGENIFVVNSLISPNGCSLSADEAVEIDGIFWATRNVDAPGTFVENPENTGMFYQWNSAIAWSSTEPMVSSDGSSWNGDWNGNGASAWETANDVCPAGYRMPHFTEQQRLANAGGGSQWTAVNGVNGRIFGSGDNTIFLPATGSRAGRTGVLGNVNLQGHYWSTTRYYYGGDYAYCLDFGSSFVNAILNIGTGHHGGFQIRCVKLSPPTGFSQKDTITVNPVEFNTASMTICQHELPYSWRDTVFHVGTESKQIVFERQTVAGCDSIVTLDLIVIPIPHHPTVQATICPGDSIFFYGKYYKETGIYTDTLPPFGLPCGAIVTLDLTVSSAHYENASLTICQNELPFTWRDTTFAVGTESGAFVFKKQIAEGCDSIITLDLTVKPGLSVTVLERTVCLNDAVHLIFTGVAPFELDYIFNGARQTITVSGMDTALVATQVGENIFVVNSLISASGCSLSDDEAVEIDGIFWATRNVDAPGAFAKNPEDAGMFYQWNNPVGWSSTDPLVSTDGSSWDPFWRGNGATAWETTNNVCPTGFRAPTHAELQSLANAGSQWTTVNGVNGRIFGSGDNTIFLPAAGSRISNGQLHYVNTAGQYWSATKFSMLAAFGMGIISTDALPNHFPFLEEGCFVRCVKLSPPTGFSQKDTITVNPVEFNTVSMTICPGESVLFNHKYYDQTGIYTDTLTAISGCDSIVTLDLTVIQDYNYIIRDAVCQGQNYNLYNFNLTNVQSFTTETQYLTTAACGNDSIVTLELSVNPGYSKIIEDTICQGRDYNLYNFDLTNVQSSTTEVQYLQTVFGGCDSIVTLKLIVNPASYDAIYATICQGQDYKLHNFNLTNVQHSIMTSQSWTTTLGCDSIIALYLTVNPLDITRIDKTISVGEGYNENGFAIPVQNADTTISETLHLKNQNLCDSTVILTLNVVSCVPDMVPVFDSICAGEPYYFDNKLLSESGIYFESGINSAGCDSVTVLDFKVLPKYHNDIYEEIIIGEAYIFNGRTYRQSGVYNERFVAVSDCDSTVTLYLKVVPRCPEIEIPTYFSPNSDGINDYWKIKNIECYSYYKITLCDRFGKKLYVWENNFPDIGWDGVYLGKPMPSTDYWYVITFEEVQSSYVGHFTLMR